MTLNSFNIEGTIILMEDLRIINDTLKKRPFVLGTEGEYPQELYITAINKCADFIGRFNDGDRVNVSFNLRGKENNGKWYNSLDAYKIERVD